MDVVIFPVKICTGMKLRYRKVFIVSLRNTEMHGGTYLVHIKNSQSETTKPLSPITKWKRGAVGASLQQTVWI